MSAALLREGSFYLVKTRLAGKTLGILGLGRIGAAVAKIAPAFQMPVIAWSENLTAEAATERGARRVEKDELFARSDILSVHQLLSPRSRGLVGQRELSLMRPDAWLVNTSRGPIIDNDALARALASGKVWGAGLDVFETEPLPADSPLRGFDNVILTPHVAANSEESVQDLYRTGCNVVLDVLHGRWPPSVVNPEAMDAAAFRLNAGGKIP